MSQGEQGEDLAAWRLGLHLSQAACCAKVEPKITQGTWAAWERGKKVPDLHHAFEIERLTEGAIKASGWARPRAKPRRAEPSTPRLPPTGTDE